MPRASRTLLAQLHRLAAPAPTDATLLARWSDERDHSAFALLTARHGPMVLGVCRRVLGNRYDAEDAFQATFLVLARKAARLHRPEAVASFLYGVALRIARKARVTAERRKFVPFPPQASEPIDPRPQPLDVLSGRELLELLDAEIARLPEVYRLPVLLCLLQGRTVEEAARQLGWSIGSFRGRLERGREQLRRRLNRRGLALSVGALALLAPAALPEKLLAESMHHLSGPLPAAIGVLAGTTIPELKLKIVCLSLFLIMAVGFGAGLSLRQAWISDKPTALTPVVPSAQAEDTLSAPLSQSRPLAAIADNDKRIEIKGRILDPDGKPLSGANVYISTYKYKDKTDPEVRAKSDAEGRFRFLAQRTEMDEENMVTAVAPGYGPDWKPLKAVRDGKELTLRLAKDDVPIKGRILDLQDRPIVGATIRIGSLRKIPGDDLSPWLKELREQPNDRKYGLSLSSLWGLLGMPKFVKTGEDGRFELYGIGRERVVLLHIEGPGIEYRVMTVITRNGPAEEMPSGLHGAAFNHLAAPNKPIRGTVRERGTGKPVSGAHVYCQGAEGGQVAITDKDGHYDLPGIRKSIHYIINVVGPPIIRQSKEAVDTPGLQPVTMDFDVERGLALRVSVTEKDTGKPVRGFVQYAVASDNRNLDRYTTYPRIYQSWNGRNEKDGTYEQVVLPGPGYILFRVMNERYATNEHYARSRLKGKENEGLLGGVSPGPLCLDTFHAVVPINPSANDPKSLICSIVLDRGRTLTGTVVDPEGRPLTGTMVCGLDAVMNPFLHFEADYTLESPNFTVTGLDPRYPRGLIFYHAEKKLVKIVEVRTDDKRPLVVRLEPFGAITGRLVDAAGKPKAGVAVYPLLGKKQQYSLPAELVFTNSLYRPLLSSTSLTDEEGRFRIESLAAGLRYDLGVTFRRQFIGRVLKDVAGKPGATEDVGEIKSNTPFEDLPCP